MAQNSKNMTLHLRDLSHADLTPAWVNLRWPKHELTHVQPASQNWRTYQENQMSLDDILPDKNFLKL